MANLTRKIGLLIGDEEDWPRTFISLVNRLKLNIRHKGDTYNFEVEPVRIHPFALASGTEYHIVIDRLAYWYQHPREWLKKAAFLNNVYLLNNPFTFQAMEKHAAYCAMMRCGLNIPETWLIPTKQPPADPTFAKKFEKTARRYNDLFDLGEIAGKMSYPLYMKPFDGGGWRGVSRIPDEETLFQQYDSSGTSLMHLQKSVEPFDVFVRTLAIGPQAISLRYDPTQPHHGRYQVETGFLSDRKMREARQMVKLINSFFRWEFNSCECIYKDDKLWAIDFANACPDIAVNSLHYFYPWALKALVKWTIFCTVTRRRLHVGVDPTAYFEVADSGRNYDERMDAYEELADDFFHTDEFNEFCDKHLRHFDEVALEYFQSPDFDDMTRITVNSIFPPHEQEQFFQTFRGAVHRWAGDTRAGRAIGC